MDKKNNGIDKEKSLQKDDAFPSILSNQNGKNNSIDAQNNNKLSNSFKISDDNLQQILHDDSYDDSEIQLYDALDKKPENIEQPFIQTASFKSEIHETDYDTFERELESYEKRNKIIKYGVSGAALIMVLVSVFFVTKHLKRPQDNLIESQYVDVTDYFGNIVTDEHGENITEEEPLETETVEVTNSDGEKVTDKAGNAVTKIVGVTTKAGQNAVTKTTKKPSGNNGDTTKQGETPTTTKKSTTTKKPTTTRPKNPINEQAGVLGFLWNEKDEVFYSAANPWQRQFGYNRVYDIGAGLFVIYMDTVRIKFDYGGLNWMVQCWKGQYGFVLLGAEVGVYYKQPNSVNDHYECVDDSNKLHVGYTVYNKGDVLFERTYQSTWWLTGFVGGKLDRFADRSQMTMKIRITLKDSEMAEKFSEALEKPGVGFTQGNANDPDTYYRSGKDVYFMWKTNREKTT